MRDPASCLNCTLGTMCFHCRDLAWMIMLRVRDISKGTQMMELAAATCNNYKDARAKVADKNNSLQLNLFGGAEQ